MWLERFNFDVVFFTVSAIALLIYLMSLYLKRLYIVASELKDPICHSDECQIGSFSSE